jgi:P27 family predicted phage terminase small subunit
MSTGRRGPAPEPAAVKAAKGNPGRRPINEEELAASGAGGANTGAAPSEGAGGEPEQTAAVAVQPPDWINADGLAVWNRLAPRLVTMRLLQLLDADTFGRYCQDFGRWVKLQSKLDREGETYTSQSPHGEYIRSHPAFMQADRLNRTLLAFEQNFGLNPADRQRLFAARAAAGAGAGGADLFGNSEGAGGGDDNRSPAATPERRGPIGLLN